MSETQTPVAERMPGKNGGELLRGRAGHPRVSSREFYAILRGKTPALADKLIQLALKGNVPALQLALAYAVGKPAEKMELTGANGGPIEFLQGFDDHEKAALRSAIQRSLIAAEVAEG